MCDLIFVLRLEHDTILSCTTDICNIRLEFILHDLILCCTTWWLLEHDLISWMNCEMCDHVTFTDQTVVYTYRLLSLVHCMRREISLADGEQLLPALALWPRSSCDNLQLYIAVILRWTRRRIWCKDSCRWWGLSYFDACVDWSWPSDDSFTAVYDFEQGWIWAYVLDSFSLATRLSLSTLVESDHPCDQRLS